MWLPPFKIIKGLFASAGQFTLPDGSEYSGPYHTTADGADFTGAIIDDSQREDLCSRATGVNSKTGNDTYESLDCLSLNVRSRK